MNFIVFRNFFYLGFIQNTRVSFTSFTSSFSECVRKHHHISSISNDISCTSTPYVDCPTMERVSLSSTEDASFTNCNFISCNNGKDTHQEHGGAISYDVSNGNLLVSSCYFSDCIAYSMDGGAIDARNTDSVTVSLSSFVHCVTHTTSLASGGGGIHFYKIQQPFIDHCIFLFCESADDAGGMGIYDSFGSEDDFIYECCCVYCAGNHPSSSGGGGLMISSPACDIECSDCLFCHCHSAWMGGALFFYYPNSARKYCRFTFCFLEGNSAPAGNDAYFNEWTPTQPFLYCFSLTPGSRIFPGSHDNDWLSITTVSLSVIKSHTHKLTLHSQRTYRGKGKFNNAFISRRGSNHLYSSTSVR